METKTLSFTLPVELADRLEQALLSDHVSLEQIAMGWLLWGRGISEPGAPPRLASVAGLETRLGGKDKHHRRDSQNRSAGGPGF